MISSRPSLNTHNHTIIPPCSFSYLWLAVQNYRSVGWVKMDQPWDQPASHVWLKQTDVRRPQRAHPQTRCEGVIRRRSHVRRGSLHERVAGRDGAAQRGERLT